MNNFENKYDLGLELSIFLKDFSKEYQMISSIQKISSESILTLTPFSPETSSIIDSNDLIEILLKNNIHFIRYNPVFNKPFRCNYYKVHGKGLKHIDITDGVTFKQYIRKEKLKIILNGE